MDERIKLASHQGYLLPTMGYPLPWMLYGLHFTEKTSYVFLESLLNAICRAYANVQLAYLHNIIY